MQFMRQIHRISSPTMVSSWSGTAIGKILFFLTIAVCVLSEAQSPPDAAESRPEKLTFSGRVVDSDGVPVANAGLRYAVSFYPLEAKSQSAHSYYGHDFFTRTGREGTFRFELVPSRIEWMPFDSEGMLSRLNIAVTHSDHAIWWQEFPFQSAADVEIQLEIPEIISGKVMNEAGEPIQNAEILMNSLSRGDSMSREPGEDLDHYAFPQPVKTDVNGMFVLRGLPQGAKASFDVKGPGYAEQKRNGVPVGTEGLKFWLKRESRVEGRLTYADTGKPVKEAGVALEGIYPTHQWENARVDANGNYVFENLTPGTYSLYLNYGPKGWTAIGKDFVTVTKEQTVSNIDMTLIRSGFITGRVTDQDTNEPIANHTIRLKDAARPEGSQLTDHRTETDRTGVYRFDAAPGQALVHTDAPAGYQDSRSTERFDIGQVQRRVDVVEDETVVVDFQFSRGMTLVGRVLTEAGEPVAGARISNVRDWHRTHRAYARSDKSGRFTVGGLRSGQTLGLKAEHSDLRLRGTAEIEVQPDTSVEIQMEPYGLVKVSGRVIDREGKPMPSMDIQLTRWDLYGGYGTNVAVTGNNGWFRGIELIVGDRYTISVEAAGYREATTEQFTATAEMTEIADLILLPAGGQFFIEGRVTDTSGEPVRSVGLGINQGGQRWSGRTDGNGNYRFENLSMAVVAGMYIFNDPRYAQHEFKILRTNQRHDLVLVKADGDLAGKVVDADGQPIERAWVRIRGKEDPSSGYRYPAGYTNVHGEFKLQHIKDPVVSVRVNDRKYRKTFEDIAVNQRDLVFALTPADARPEPTPEQQAKRSYGQACRERFKTLVSQPAPELTVAEWVSGSPVSIEDLQGKTVALYFWALDHVHHIEQIRLLNILQEVYRDKGLVCVAICPSTSAVETLKQHIAEESLSYSIGLDRSIDVVGAEGETFDRYAMNWGGEIVLIDPAGEIAGRAWENEYEDKIQALLAD